MPTPLDGQVTRPQSFSPPKDYALVIALGDEWLGDYDVNDLGRILRYDLAVMSRLLFAEGAVLFESGGIISAAIAGVNLGQDALGAAGTYTGIESQVYTVRVATGGPVGAATYTWQSTGSDNPDFFGVTFPIRAIAASVSAGLADLATYGHALGSLGVVVVFANANGTLTGANSWIVPVTYRAQPPIVNGATITLADALVPVSGRLHRVAGTALTYPAASSGNSVIYGEWTRTYITEADDADLVDPVSDTPQAARERWRMAYRASDTSALPPGANELERRVFPLYVWNRATDEVRPLIAKPYAIDIGRTEGALEASRLLNIDQNEIFKGTFARRDSGAHGSYVISPLPPHPRATKSTNAASSGKIRLALPPAVVSVEGVEIVLPRPTEIEVDQALDTIDVVNEIHTYTAAANPFPLNTTQGVRTLPVKQVTLVSATVQVGVLGSGGYEAKSRGAGTDDVLAHDNVASLGDILRISNTNGGAADYTPTTNYTLVGGNAIHWVSGAPSQGATYYVVYRYGKTMVTTTDYLLTASGEIDFSPAGDNPVEGSQFEVSYQAYVNRYDSIILRPNGTFAVVRGIAAAGPLLPTLPVLVLPYVQVEIPANSLAVRIHNYQNDRVTMEQINLMRAALEELTQDLALQDLENQARARSTANLIDILAEDFTTTVIADPTFDVDGIAFACTIDTDAAELGPPFTQGIVVPAWAAAPAGETDVRVGEAFFTLPFDHELAITAPYWSQNYPVNPYADFRPDPPLISVTPDQDFSVDATTGLLDPTVVQRINAHQALRLGLVTAQQVRTFKQQFARDHGRPPTRSDVIGTVQQGTGTAIAETAALYMRQIVIALTGAHFVPEEKLRLHFAGRTDVPFTADAPTTQGADAYTIVATAADVDVNNDVIRQRGDVTAHFTIPSLVPTGTVAVELWGDQGKMNSVWPDDYTLRAQQPFTSNGVIRQTLTQERLVEVTLDPVAQSVLFPEVRMISKVDIPLAAKPATGGAPITFEIHATDRSGQASTPLPLVLASQTKEAIDCTSGDNSSNIFEPGDPVLAPADEFRALMLRSVSNAYEIYVAQLGAPNRAAGGYIESQQTPDGIFMDSANLRDWTLRQGWDLRCKVWVAKMTATQARLYYERITTANLTAFMVQADQAIPDGTAIDWEYAIDGKATDDVDKVWVACVPFLVTDLPAVASELDLRATLSTNSDYLTPGIHRANCSVVLQTHALALTYVTRQKVLSGTAVRIKGAVEMLLPQGATASIFVSVGDGVAGSWVEATIASQTGLVDGFTALTFEATPFTGTVKTKLRVRIDATTADRALRTRHRRLYAYMEPA